ncbi:MAG TPA: Gfo/Idh/MocA family oxidoreductase [Clostridiaceae bacterium]|nr:Gfo/Idh/MocA family oxidoreductase [Clostridiaceae bacterium]
MLNKTTNQSLSVALIGVGRVAVKHLKAIRFWEGKKKLHLLAAVDPKIESAAAKLKELGFKQGIPVFKNMEQMLREARPDICAITTPSGSHFVLAKKALEAGCHLLLEKPFTLDLDEADFLLEKAANNNIKIAVGHIFRYMIGIQELREDLASGRFGRVLYGNVTVRWGHDQAYYDQAKWRGSWQQDGGALMNQTVHALDLMSYLCNALPVTATGELARIRHDIEAEDLGLGIFRLANGALLAVEGTTAGPPQDKEASLFIQTEKANIRASKRGRKIRLSVRAEESQSLTGSYLRRSLGRYLKKMGLSGLWQLTNPHTSIYADLMSAIKEDREPIASGLSGRDAVAMVLSLYQSYREKRTVRFPPTERRITPQEL